MNNFKVLMNGIVKENPTFVLVCNADSFFSFHIKYVNNLMY